MKKISILITVFALLVGCSNITTSKKEEKNTKKDPKESVRVHNTEKIRIEPVIPKGVTDFQLEKQPYIGAPNVAHTMVVFTDYDDQSTLNWYETEYPKILEKYVFPKPFQMNIYFINKPSEKHESLIAALGAETLFKQGRMAFSSYHEGLITFLIHERKNNSNFVTDQVFIQDLLKLEGNGWDPNIATEDFLGEDAINELGLDLAVSQHFQVKDSLAIFIDKERIYGVGKSDPSFEDIQAWMNKWGNK